MSTLLNQQEFIEKYKIDKEKFSKTKLKWANLVKIHDNYLENIPNLEDSAIYIFNNIMKIPNVHSVRYRIKSPEHVIEKIIRKKIASPQDDVNLSNYLVKLKDLIGVRALHLFKSEWKSIHESINHSWESDETVANYREGDSKEYIQEFKNMGCDTKEHPYGYRSVHYIVPTKPAKFTYYAEIQVRTIFEEGWSEIDHTIRYPYDQDKEIYLQFSLILNRLAGSADEMGAFASYLKKQLEITDAAHKSLVAEKDTAISELEAIVKKSSLKKEEVIIFDTALNRLRADNAIIQNSSTSLNANTIINSYNSQAFANNLYLSNIASDYSNRAISAAYDVDPNRAINIHHNSVPSISFNNAPSTIVADAKANVIPKKDDEISGVAKKK